MNRKEITSSGRMAGRVMRYHTWPTLQQQTNADHTWHVMRIYFHLFGPMPSEVSTWILFHDAGELGPGDIPHPFKKENPVLGAEHSRLEAEVVSKILGDAGLSDLKKSAKWLEENPEYGLRIKLCDLLEMNEFGKVEVLMGNHLAHPIKEATWKAICDLLQKFADLGHTHLSKRVVEFAEEGR